MKRRIVNYGCSHAFGAEIAGRGNSHHPDNVRLNFGNLVAQHFDCDFKIAARPGNSNRQILHDVIEFVQPSDICLMSWTYADRERWIVPENTTPDNNINYTSFHTLSVLTENNYKDSFKSFRERFFPGRENEEIDHEDRTKIERNHHFLKNINDPIIKSISQAHYDYYSKPGIQTMNFLEIYKCANEIIKSRGAIAVNFHYDMEPEIMIFLKFYEEMFTKFLHSKASYYNYYNEVAPEVQDYFLTHTMDTENSELYKFYQNDTTRIDWVKEVGVDPEPYSFKQWYTEKNYGDRDMWPNGRLGHLDGEGHRVLAEFIKDKLKEILDAN
jgi:hypothetical protein